MDSTAHLLHFSDGADLESIARRVRNGDRISRNDAIELWQRSSLSELGSLAQVNRNKFNPPARVTYLIDRNINYTNVCNSDCSFCGFYRHDPKHPESYVISRELLGKKIEEALAIGATRILLQGGHNDDLPYNFYLDLISWIHQNYPIEINSFSPSEIQQIAKVAEKSTLVVLTELQAAGMRGLPGGGAEILDDEIRKRVSPKKIRTDDWLAIMEEAQGLDLTTTASMVIGFGETIEHRLNHLERIRALQSQSQQKGLRGFNAFISWPLQFNENTSLGRSRHASSYGVNAPEYLRLVALARIYLDNIPHVQSSWPTCGPEVAAVGLHFGCDDFGSTMMEENVVSQAGALSKDLCSMSAEDLRHHISRAGFSPAQRDSSFNIVKVF